jgi:hypothetical protein
MMPKKNSLKFFGCTQVMRNASSTMPAPVVQLQLNLKRKSQKKKEKKTTSGNLEIRTPLCLTNM